MKAFTYAEPGSAEKVLTLCDIETPVPSKGEVRVQIRASGINPSDTKRRSGEFPQPNFDAPIVPHSDGSGVVDRVGNDVPDSWIGKRVWFHNAQWNSPNGAACEYICVPIEHVAILPEQVTFEAGATFGVPLLTAWYGVHIGGDLKGKNVMISGGAGAVGAYAIQLAKLKGARVITTASNDAKAKLAKKFGADVVLNYKQDDVETRVMEITKGEGVDHYIEVNLGANTEQLSKVLATGATVATYGSDQPGVNFNNIFKLFFKRATLSFFIVYDLPAEVLKQAKDEIYSLLKSNKLAFNLGQIYHFGDIVSAHKEVEKGSMGNVVLCQCPHRISDYLQQQDKVS